ncbi:hypothetical protein [Fusibacter bizertensis]
MQTLTTNKTKLRIFIVLLVIIAMGLGGFIKARFFPTFYNITYATGYVIDRYQENINNKTQNVIVVKFIENTLTDNSNVKLIVDDINIWNDIQIDNAYYVCYKWINQESPELVELQLNTEFMEIYDKDFNNK